MQNGDRVIEINVIEKQRTHVIEEHVDRSYESYMESTHDYEMINIDVTGLLSVGWSVWLIHCACGVVCSVV